MAKHMYFTFQFNFFHCSAKHYAHAFFLFLFCRIYKTILRDHSFKKKQECHIIRHKPNSCHLAYVNSVQILDSSLYHVKKHSCYWEHQQHSLTAYSAYLGTPVGSQCWSPQEFLVLLWLVPRTQIRQAGTKHRHKKGGPHTRHVFKND